MNIDASIIIPSYNILQRIFGLKTMGILNTFFIIKLLYILNQCLIPVTAVCQIKFLLKPFTLTKEIPFLGQRDTPRSERRPAGR